MMNSIFFKTGLLFFFNLIITQSSSSSAASISHLKNLLDQKQFSELKEQKDKIDSEVLTRWLDYELLLFNIKKKPDSINVKTELTTFIKKYRGHRFSDLLVETYFNEIDEIVQNSNLLRDLAINFSTNSLGDPNPSLHCLKNIGKNIESQAFQGLVMENESRKGCQRLIMEWLTKEKMNPNFYIERARYSAKKGDLEFSMRVLTHLKKLFKKKSTGINEDLVLKIIYRSSRNSREAYRLFKESKKLFNKEQKSYLQLQLGTALFGVTHRKAWDTVILGLDSISKHPSETLEIVARMALRRANYDVFDKALTNLPGHISKNENWMYWKAKALEKQNQTNKAMKIFETLGKKQSFYGFLASARIEEATDKVLNKQLVYYPKSLSLTNNLSWENNNQLKDILKLFESQIFHIGLSEWKFFIKDFSTDKLLNLASYLSKIQIYDRSISAAIYAHNGDSFQFKYPLAFEESVAEAGRISGVPPWLIMGLIRQESRFNKEIRSSAGAVGLMQILPKTALETRKNNKAKLNLTNPNENIRLGSRYLSKLLSQFNNSIPLSLAAYNAGPSRARKWIADGKKKSMSAAMFIESIPFKETREYVQAVIVSSAIYKELLTDIIPDKEIHKDKIIINFNEILDALRI